MYKFLITSLLSLLITFSANAGTDGENNLSKNKPRQVKDCFEKLNRATFTNYKAFRYYPSIMSKS